MTIRNFERMFQPRSLALIGVGERPRSVGQVLLQNVMESGFSGPVMPVNPKYETLAGMTCYRDVASLPQAPDLAVLCTAAAHVPPAIAELGARGTRAAVVISAGFAEVGTPEGRQLEQDMLAASRPYNMRIIGPNCVGVMVPGAGLNASFAHIAPSPGSLAFVSQSGALCTAILDNVANRDIGFSHFISLGNCSDVDFGDMLDYLANDAGTSAILLYIESVTMVRKFMSSGRAAARNKPVIVIKSGRNKAGAKAAASHTGALIGSDAVYDEAFRRAGMLRVYDMEELFDAVETLARVAPRLPLAARVDGNGSALTIVTNGGGPAVLATDYLAGNGGTLQELAPPTIEKLNAVLPPTWSHGNPVDIIGDADGARYGAALENVLADPGVEAVLVMKCPTAVSDNVEAARAVIATCRAAAQKAARERLLLSCWLGEATAHESRRLFAEAGVPTYETPEKAVRAFLHMKHFRHNQALLLEVAPRECPGLPRDRERASAVISAALAQGREELFENEAKDVFAAYGIPVVRTVTVDSPEGAASAAETIGFPVVLKIVSPDISHKSDVGGVILSLGSAQAVRAAAEGMAANVKKLKPDARLQGFNVQQMVEREGYELIVGGSTDRQFGPVIMFGEGGVAVEVIDDKALGLPPLNVPLALHMVKSTRVYRRLKGFRDRKPVNLDAVVQVLVQVSQLMSELAEVTELDINPLVADSNGVIALDGRIKIARATQAAQERLAIGTYPAELEEPLALRDGRKALLRPVRPADAPALQEMMARLTPQDLYHRFLGEYPVLIPEQTARLTQIDYEREIVFVITPEENANGENKGEIYACLLCTMHPGSNEAEFNLMVRSDLKGLGLGYALITALVNYGKKRPSINALVGYALEDNRALADLARELDFSVEPAPEAGKNMVRIYRKIT